MSLELKLEPEELRFRLIPLVEKTNAHYGYSNESYTPFDMLAKVFVSEYAVLVKQSSDANPYLIGRELGLKLKPIIPAIIRRYINPSVTENELKKFLTEIIAHYRTIVLPKGNPKKINEYFFHQDSKEMYYVLGAFFGGGHLTDYGSVIFRSNRRELVEIVRRELGSEHKIMKDSRMESYYLGLRGMGILYSKLEEFGLAEKHSRRFPENIPAQYISHFVRGFIDSEGGVGARRIRISFPKLFLQDLNEVLVNNAYTAPKNVQQLKNGGCCIYYGVPDIIRIYAFTYRNLDLDGQNNLYIHGLRDEMRRIMPEGIEISETIMKQRQTPQERIDEAKRLLLNGMRVRGVAETLGFLWVDTFIRNFKRTVGVTPTEFVKSNAGIIL